MTDQPQGLTGGPLADRDARTRERVRRHNATLSNTLNRGLVDHAIDPNREIMFWNIAKGILAPRPRLAEVRANFFLFVLVVAVTYGGWCVWDRFLGQLPSTVVSTVVTNAPVAAGDEADIAVRLNRNRVCERDFDWILQDARGRRTIFHEPHLHAVGRPGPDDFVKPFRVPRDTAPGPGHLRIVWAWQCPENLYELVFPVTYVVPDVPIRIAPPDDPNAPPHARDPNQMPRGDE